MLSAEQGSAAKHQGSLHGSPAAGEVEAIAELLPHSATAYRRGE